MTVLHTSTQVLELFEMLSPLRRTSYAGTSYSLVPPALGERGNLVVVVDGVRFPVSTPEGSDLYLLLTSLSAEHPQEGNISLAVTALSDLATKEWLGGDKSLLAA